MLSLCMIVKNEEHFIRDCLTSVKNVMGLTDLVVADTGSTDDTKRISAECGAKVLDFNWNGDFAAARNFAAAHAAHDWVFYIDADEVVEAADMDAVKNFIANGNGIGEIKLIEMTDNSVDYLSRLYNKKFFRLEETIHEQLRALDGASFTPVKIPVTMRHYGRLYRSKEASNQKYNYYIQLLKKSLSAKPNDPYLLCQLGKVYAFFPQHLLKSCECFAKVFNANPDLKLRYIYDALVRYGYSLINSAQYTKALELVREYENAYENYDEFTFLTAQVYQNNGMLIEATQKYESCINNGEDKVKGINSFLAYYNIGVILEALGLTQDAESMYIHCGGYEPAKKRLDTIRRL